MSLTAAQVQALEDRTEGWIAALQLAAISLQGRSDVAAFITGFAGDDRYVVDYLVEEVLAHQPAPVREFLLHSSVLDRLSGPLCDAVLDRDDAAAMLRTLERDNLFLVALDDRREWFRYHQLFGDVLRARLLAEQPDLAPVLHGRAAEWFEQHGFTDDAIEHALAAGTSTGPPPWWSWPCRRSAGTGRRPRCRAGWAPCPTTPSGAAPCSACSPRPCC